MFGCPDSDLEIMGGLESLSHRGVLHEKQDVSFWIYLILNDAVDFTKDFEEVWLISNH